ncbi:MAG TPA: SCO family protein [Thermoanaerobaculia bacterium]|nr:SCO family protein [Thermoanaerobaculia bacterium]
MIMRFVRTAPRRWLATWALTAGAAVSLGSLGGTPLVAQTQTLVAPSASSLAQGTPVDLPEELRSAGFDQRLGERLDLDVELVDHEGRAVRLGDLFRDDRPVLFAPVYYGCPMLCSLVLDGVMRNLKPLTLLPGEDFQVVALSFDPTETPEDAAGMRESMLDRYRREEGNAGFHFLTGEPERVAKVMEELGVRYQLDPATGEYTHAGGIVLLTPGGEISRYFFGVDYPSRDLRLGLVEASEGKIGSLIDQVLLYCYRYDPEIGKYSAVTLNIIRLGAVLTVVLLALFIGLSLLRERRRGREARALSERQLGDRDSAERQLGDRRLRDSGTVT